MAVNPNTDFTAGAVLTAAQQNRFPRGVMGDASTTSSYNLTGTLADVPGLSFTFTAVAGRLYKFIFFCGNALTDTEGTNRLQTRMILGSTNIYSAYQGSMSYGNVIHLVTLWTPGTPAAGSITAKMQAYRDNGASGGQLFADANTPMRFWCEDVGPY